MNSCNRSKTSFLNEICPTFVISLLLSNIFEGVGYIDNILELKSKSHYDYIHKCYFLSQVLGQKVFTFKIQ